VRIDIITIFPEYFGPLRVSLIGKAADRGDITFGVHDLRSWTHDVHHTVDDTPFGGGPGMVMKPEPWGEVLDVVAARGQDPLLIVPTPAGEPFTQQHAASFVAEPWLIFACGRYEGIDGRVIDEARSRMRVAEVSLGDYVLAGGEAAVLVMTEAIGRLLPGVLGNAESAGKFDQRRRELSHAAHLAAKCHPARRGPGQHRRRFCWSVMRRVIAKQVSEVVEEATRSTGRVGRARLPSLLEIRRISSGGSSRA